ncbi:ABC transporter substrate-binding protein [Cohnella lupini]|uniref:ABC-type glycerol-3-phosphate transport system substrate-binding protein n=1 Tax=Cohnella lupini TaxID=1294267 RepID=A0A3D9HNZ1_9BACL|nr:ABC transporter substrate-binding protein [Cohnella lupini]RED51189.1 ABC-type glycerol-3-phosphate transport system substrate-binding protein [Cohnella lupini]
MKKTKAVVAGLVALMLMMTAVLTGCSSNKEIKDTSSETSGEVVWWGWTPGSPTNEKYIEAFNKEYPDIKVTWKQTSIDAYDAALKPALANGKGVDAFEASAGSGNGGIQTFGGQAIDLTEAVKKALGDDYKDKLNEAAITTMTVNSQLKALGVGTVYSGNLWINQDLFDKYNVKIPTNLDEWKKACEIFEQNGINGFVQGAGQGAFNIDTFHAIADNVSTGNFTKATRGEVQWTDDSIVKALELWKGLFDDGIMQKGALGIQQYPEANNLFMSQKAAMVMMGSWYTSNALPDAMKSAMESAASTEEPFTMIPIPFPDLAGTGNTGSMFGDLDYSTAVSAKSNNIKAATTFAVWLGTSQSGQQIIADSLNVVPSLKSATPDWDNVKLVNPEKQNEPIKEYLQNAMNSGDNPRFAGINADMNQVMMDVLAGVAGGTITPSDGAAQLAQTQADSE